MVEYEFNRSKSISKRWRVLVNSNQYCIEVQCISVGNAKFRNNVILLIDTKLYASLEHPCRGKSDLPMSI